MRFVVQPRHEASRRFSGLLLVGSVAAGFVAVGVVFAASGVDPFYAIWRILGGSFGSLFGLKETLTKAIPLVLIGAGLSVAYGMKFWNIGAESQLLAGAMAAGWLGLTFGPSLPAALIVPIMFLGGFAGGALWAVPPALLKVKFGVNEVVSTLMLNYAGQELLRMLIVGPWKGKTQGGFPYSDDLAASARIALVPGTRIHLATLVVALLVALACYLLVSRSRFGYELRVVGENTDAARYAGIDFWRTTVLAMVVSGGAAGLAGVGEIAGVHHHLTYPEAISSGYGFAGIIVAWLAKLNPAACVISGLFLAGILVGGDAIQISLGLPAATVQVFEGVILFFLVAGEYLLKNRVRLVRGGARRGPA